MTAVRDASEPTFVIPDDWVIDPLVRSRLTTQLDRAPATVSAIVAPAGQIPPGSSYRVHGERCVLRPVTDLAEADQPIPGAALVRAGVAYEQSEAGIVIGSGAVLVDRGTHVHDPWADVAPLEPASALGRSPFPRRPMVLFLKCEGDDELDLADWSRALVNELVRQDVEARLARTGVTPGLQLTRPCLPVEESVRALRPDVIVALDDLASDNAARWCEGDRHTILVEHSVDPSLTVELVSWRIGRSQGRVRARIGQAVDSLELSRLVARLCSGPQPLPPPKDAVDINVTPLAVPVKATTAPTPRQLCVVRSAAEVSNRIASLLEYAARVGWAASAVGPDAVDDVLMRSDVFMIDHALPDDFALALIERRLAMGRRAVVDVSGRRPSSEAVSLLARCGYAIVGHPSEWEDGWRGSGARVQVLPPLLRPSELLALADARKNAATPGERTSIGLAVEAGANASNPCKAIALWREQDPDLDVRVWGDLSSVPTTLRATADERAPAPAERAALSVVLVASREPIEVADGLPPELVELALLGVPAVFEQGRSSGEDAAFGRFAVPASADADAWAAAAMRAVDDPHIVTYRARLAMRADALFGLKPSQSIVNRVLGWATFERRAT